MTESSIKTETDRPAPAANASEKQQEINDVSREFHSSLSMGNGASTNDDSNDSPPTAESPSTDQSDAKDKRFVAPKDFELLKVIGMGAFGKVLQVRNRKSSQIFAMKVISKRLLQRKTSYVENVLAERNILSKIANHPFIVTMHASFQTKEKLFIIMDFCAGGELFLKLGREGIFRERTAAFYLAEITLALEHLHSVNVLHRDLKPENILLGSDGHCCLTDFGLAKDFTGHNSDNDDERARTLCGTMEYMSPEMVARKWYGKGADFWSLGCIAFEMLSGRPPFSADRKGSKELFRKIMNERIRMPDGASASACKLLKGLLNRDVSKRLGAAKGTMFEVGGVGALKQQPFFAGLDWGKLELKEVEPPEDFSVSNDEDLRHFHEEFTNMTLPRSVKEMSELDFLPRHCKSDHFRGFSFISSHFPLPERTNSEEMHYWNNVDGDGQSLSDCASDVFDDDMREVNALPVEQTPEKKKRPPRKKKKAQSVPLETANEEDEKYELAADTSTAVEKNDSEKPQTDFVMPIDIGEASISVDTKEIQFTPEVPKIPQASLFSTTTIPSVAKGNPTSLNPNANSWNAVSNKKQPSGLPVPALLTNAKPVARLPQVAPTTVSKEQALAAKATTPIKTNTNISNPVGNDTYKPKPGTWASMAVGKGSQLNNSKILVSSLNANPGLKPTAQSKLVSPLQHSTPQVKSIALSPDWRNHVVSPHRRVSGQSVSLNMINVPPPPMSQPQQKTWQSLDEFGPSLGQAQKETTKQTKPMGVWGSKPL